ncbi:type VI secretion system tube protein TssD [Taibaiella koreensis]|uniref:type VI secretion system tube protein TssD n=1 Tax=Taibaiella koreensis TaxID=1268548 RepID=UPI000E59AEE9|nr:type VI secretion system tube protein TssD [Taibaiella koreensis]
MATSASKLAVLDVNGTEFNVFQASFESLKPVDQWNRVTAYATKADARFVIEGNDKTSKLFEMYSNSRKRFNAKLTLFNTHDEGKLVETNFNDCSITYYSSKYNSSDEVPYTITVVFSPKVTTENAAELAFEQHT